MTETVFKVLPSDIGRSITDIRPDLDVDLKPLLTTVLQDGVNLEQEVQNQDGRWYRLQMKPYRTLGGRIDGQWNKPDLRVLLEEVLPHDKDFLNHEVVYEFPNIGWKSFMPSGRYMVQEPDAVPLILLSLTDMTTRKKIKAALIQSEKLAIAIRSTCRTPAR